MGAAFRTLALSLLSFLVYKYIVLPVSLPEKEAFRKESVGDGQWRNEDLFTFIHITDLHISKFVHLDIKDDLQEFFSTTLDTIKPLVVLASGDLTDAKDKDGVGSFQIAEEWRTYRDLLVRNNVLKKTVYLDIRGNHDSFDVHSIDDPGNMFAKHSGQGGKHRSSYSRTVQHANTSVSFIAVDATLDPGPKKVFNFLGHLPEKRLVELASLRRQAEQEQSDAVVYFSHFPSSCIVSDIPVMEMAQGGVVFLSGHLHTLGGLAPQLYTMHHTGTPELELGDWKENRRYRLLALDNGVLSFVDIAHGDWPVVLVTNPKNSDFIAPRVERIENILSSPFVRILAFSPGGIATARVKINDEDWRECEEGGANEWTLAWDPDQYSGKVNSIQVEVEDGLGRSKEVSQQFVVDQDSVDSLRYKLYARIILMGNPHSFLMFLWLTGFLVCSVPLCLARYCQARLELLTGKTVARNLALVARHKTLFHVYMFTCLYVSFGPWHVGEVLSGHIGFVFPWATVVRGAAIPSFYPYVFSLVHLFFFHQPLLWALVFKMQWRLDEVAESKVTLALTNIPVTLVLSLQAILLIVLYYFPSKLGIFREIALMLAPVEVATIIIGFVLNAIVSFHIREDKLTKRN